MGRGRRWLAGRLGAALACALLAGCGPVAHDEPSVAPPADLPPAARAAAWLADLRAVPRNDPAVPPYDRNAFGAAWRDTDGNGCNQRDDVLLRDAVPGSAVTASQGACDHDVLAGSWEDPYTGRTLTFDDLKDPRQAQGVQIDHVVPLAEAWRSGAYAWPERRRERHANDLAVLLAVDGPTNAGKGDDDPAAWRPRKAYQCTYALRWIAVKHAWRLGVDDSERRALQEMVHRCPGTTAGGPG
ncbi:MAG: HNH endonuclease family protein [Nocardioides sp.]|uniref:HNH endonuclease family protein n=1 Tax=Nocardioides sp. TaxID=35761 RepID=UPI003F00A81D